MMDLLEVGMDEYQAKARAFAQYGEDRSYPFLGLAGEVGEIAQVLKRRIRDGMSEEDARAALVDEIGDVLWYCSQLAFEWRISLAGAAAQNLAKLEDRSSRGVIKGSGGGR